MAESILVAIALALFEKSSLAATGVFGMKTPCQRALGNIMGREE
jgi:hypothetical protein